MKSNLDISFIARSDRFSLKELSALMGGDAEAGSHDKDDLHPKGAPWGTSIWRRNSQQLDAPLERQIVQLFDSLPSRYSEALSQHAGDIAACIDVAVFFRTAYVSIAMPTSLIQELSKRKIGIEITAYPCSDDEGSGDEGRR